MPELRRGALLLLWLGVAVVVGSPARGNGQQVLGAMLGTAVDLEDFWFRNFAREPVQVHASKHRPGERRVQWIRDYREFFQNEDVDRFISVNLSAYQLDSPLIYGTDLWMERSKKELDGWMTERLASFGPHVNNNLSVPLPQMQNAFRDGFSLIVNRLNYRSSKLKSYTSQLEQFFGVPVEARLRFRPASTQIWPDFHAHDTWLIQLDGQQTIRLYRSLHRDPLDHMEYAPNEQQLGHHTETVHLSEGDLIYIPRGYAYDSRSQNHVSMHVTIDVHLQKLTFRDALLVALKRAVDLPNMGYTILHEHVDAERTFTWGDLTYTCILMLADVTDEMRKLFPIKKEMLSWLQDVDSDAADVQGALRGMLVNFVRAGTDASSRSESASPVGTIFKMDGVFEPVLDVLANDPTADLYGSRAMQRWAVSAMNAGESKLSPLLETFRECLRELQNSFDADEVHIELGKLHLDTGEPHSERYQTMQGYLARYRAARAESSRVAVDAPRPADDSNRSQKWSGVPVNEAVNNDVDRSDL